MAAPAFAFTISRAAEILGEDEELLWDLVLEMESEDGCLWIHGINDEQTIAFTADGSTTCATWSPSTNAATHHPRGL